MIWEVENVLARDCRPGWPGEDVSPSEMFRWIKHVKKLGVKSIVCLLGEEHVRMYRIKTSLVNFYKVHELKAEHIRTVDGKVPGWVVCSRALSAFVKLPKPVLVHCSSGIVRSSFVADHIIKYYDWRKFYKEEKEEEAA
jgi:protein tyrosine/serine phosphatase